MLTPLTPNLAAVCLFFECSHSPAHCFNYPLPCVLSESIIQNEMHLENIKITNAHHYSHNFNLAQRLFQFWLSVCMFYQFFLKWRSALFLLRNHTLTLPSGSVSFFLELQIHPCRPHPIVQKEKNTVSTISEPLHVYQLGDQVHWTLPSLVYFSEIRVNTFTLWAAVRIKYGGLRTLKG